MNTTERVYNEIKEFIDEMGFSPSIRDIVIDAELSSTSVAAYHLKKLEEQGRITRAPNRSRTIRIVEE